MEYSWRYASTLEKVFSWIDDTSVGEVDNELITLGRHNAFNRLFVVDVSSDEIEVPTFARSVVESTVRKNLRYPHISHVGKIVIPMYVNTYNLTARTADSIVNIFFSRTNFNQRLQKVTTNKGEVYYGGKGIILDKDFNILLLCTIVCRKIEDAGKQMMSYYKPVIHVGPQVFLRNEGLMSKSILKKIIPFYISHNMDSINTHNYFWDGIPEGTKPQVLIDDVNRFIEHPAKPSPQKCSDDILNQLLIDNVDDVLNQFL